VINHFFKSGDTAVMHVWGGNRDIAQSWSAKPAHIYGTVRNLEYSLIVPGIGPFAIQVVKPSIVKFDFCKSLADVVG
jgi:hypothetical protein